MTESETTEQAHAKMNIGSGWGSSMIIGDMDVTYDTVKLQYKVA